MISNTSSPTVAVIGAGMAGTACAVGLQQGGLRVSVFDKSRGVGGRMATRRLTWSDEHGASGAAELDHGAHSFSATHPRFRAVLAAAEAGGAIASWRPNVHAAWPTPGAPSCFVPVPNMPSLCRRLLADTPLHLEHAVQRLHRAADGWHLAFSNGGSSGPYDHVMLAMPAPQAALLLAGHQEDWTHALGAVRMAPCWTLMAVTDDVDWPWDAAIPDRGPLEWVARNDRKPGRPYLPHHAVWVAHATADWSASHLEDDPQAVTAALRRALAALMPTVAPARWHHASVHRWRYAVPMDGASINDDDCWWDASLGLGICGDFFGGGTVEAAWRSGDELADTVAASLDTENETHDNNLTPLELL